MRHLTRRPIALGLLVLLSLLHMSTGTRAFSSSGNASDASKLGSWDGVWIEGASDGLCVAVPDNTEGTWAIETGCIDDALQLWNFIDKGSGRYWIQNLGSGKCLTAGEWTLGSRVVQTTCSSSSSQYWSLAGTGNNFSISNGGECLGSRYLGGTKMMVKRGCPSKPNWLLLY